MPFDSQRLKSALLNTGLQIKDPALYQVIYQLIGALSSAQSSINSNSNSSGDTNITEISNIYQIITGSKNGGSAPSRIIPGPPGIKGDTGATGATLPGPLGIIKHYTEYYPKYIPFPGSVGSTGATGAQGPMGAVITPRYTEIVKQPIQIFSTISSSLTPSGLAFLAEQIASTSATLDFTTRTATGYSGAIFQSDFDEYIIELVGILPANNNVGIGLRVRVAGVFVSTGSYAWTHWVYGPAGTGQTANTAQTEVRTIGFINASNTNTFSVNGGIRLFSPLSTALHKVFGGQIHFYDTGPSLVVDMFSGAYSATSALDGIQVLASAGNIASGAARIYGVKKS